MKYIYITCAVIFLCSMDLRAQQFTKVTSGSIATANISSGGCSWADYNNDGFTDLYISNTNTSNQLFKNNGDGTFVEITSGAIVNNGGISNSAVWGDYDNDGHLDLFVSNNPPANAAPELNFLYKNNGPPNYDFTRIFTAATQTDANYTWSSSWVDYDNDGDIDLHMPDNKHLRRDFFYENNGDGTFTSITPSFVTPNVESTGVVSWIDYDHDGDQDLFMIKSGRSHPNNGEDNRMYHNELTETGNLEFRRVTTAGMVNHFDLDFQASWGDYDNDGDMDAYLGNFDNRNYLYRNDGDSLFAKITSGPLVTHNTRTLGSAWGDYDNDGDLDMFVANTSGQTSRYYQNDGSGNFVSLSIAAIGDPLRDLGAVQGCAHADYNNDGYLDLYVANSFMSGSARNFFYLNNGGTNNFLQLTCRGVMSNTSAFGTKVWIKSKINGNDLWQLRHITGNPTGNHAQNDLRVHFGLGDATTVDSLIIDWPSGQQDVYTDIESNQFLTYVEGQITTTTEVNTLKLNAKTYPNPVQDRLTIDFNLEKSKTVSIGLFDVNGGLIKKLMEPSFYSTGQHEAIFELNNITAGTYVVVIESDAGIVGSRIIKL